MIIPIKTQYCLATELDLVQTGCYPNGRPALGLIDPEDGEPYFTVTVNLPDQEIPEGHVFVKAWSENEGLLQALIKAGVLEVIDWTPCGYTEAAECKLLIDPILLTVTTNASGDSAMDAVNEMLTKEGRDQ
jgi:hypothetical protein